jgi:hypothetical protein
MRTELVLSDAVYAGIERIYVAADSSVKFIDGEIQRLQKSDIAEDSLNTFVMNANARKKEIRQVRDLDIRMLLTPDQQKVYDERIKPAKPQVLHFGTHDRANCPVCK